MAKHALTVLPDESRLTLAAFVARRLQLAHEDAAARVERGAVYVDGRRRRRATQALQGGQKVVVFITPAAATEPVCAAFVDDDVAVVDMPAGCPSEPPRAGDGGSLAERVAARWGEGARLLHRLDREASGLLLVSLRARSRGELARQVREHALHRSYLALIGGQLARRRLLIEAPLARGQGRARVSPRGRPALTEVRRLHVDADGRQTLVQALPRTGRMHQIRAHLAQEGHPLVGDAEYRGPPASRLALHAHCLGWRHPDGRWIEVHSPLPAGWPGERFKSL